MNMVGRIAAGGVTLFSALMAGMTWIAPDRAQAALGFSGLDGLALNTFRADVGALFLLNAVCGAGAAFAGRRGWLAAPAFLFGAAATGRLLSLGLDGAAEGALQAVLVETVMVALSIAGLRLIRA